MVAWYRTRTLGWSAKAVIVAALLAALLVAAVPGALLVGLVMMLLGHVVGGLALFGASVLAAVAAVALAGRIGARHLRRLASKLTSEQGYRVVQLGRGEYHYDGRDDRSPA